MSKPAHVATVHPGQPQREVGASVLTSRVLVLSFKIQDSSFMRSAGMRPPIAVPSHMRQVAPSEVVHPDRSSVWC
jgi:hypothetical protein